MMKAWQSRTLGEVCEIKPPKSEARARLTSNAPVSFLPMEDLGINEKLVQSKQVKSLSDVVGSYTYFADGDVLLAKITPCFENGKLGIAQGLKNGVGFGSSEYIVFRPGKTLNNEWLYYYLSREIFRVEGAASMSGAVGHKRVSKEFIESYAIPIPPLSEQQRIVGILDEAFEAVATAQANVEKSRQDARAIFESHLQSIFSQRGPGWTERRLGDVVTRLTNGYVGPTRNIYHESGVPYLLARHVKNNRLLFDGKTFVSDEFNRKNKKSILKDGDVLLVQSGHIGHSAVVTKEHEGHNCHAMIVISTIREVVTGPFLSMYFNSSGMRRRFEKIRSGSTVPHLTCGAVKELTIALPDLPTQKRIVSQSQELQVETQRLASIYERKLAALETLKRALLHQAFSGELTRETTTPNVISFPKTISNITPIDMHAGILAIAYEKHESRSRQLTFGHVKAEKIAHMVESHVGIECGRSPVKDAAGPNDYRHLKQVEHRAEKAGYFSFKQNTAESYTFQKRSRFNQLIEKTCRALGDDTRAVEEIIDLMVPMQTQQAEIFATVYAAWNNLLLDEKPISDEAIVTEARENWHKNKLKIPRDKFFKAIDWMRGKNIVPTGRGKKVGSRVNA